MKLLLLGLISLMLLACSNSRQMINSSSVYQSANDTLITSSLFTDRNAAISEENISKILDGQYKLPTTLRVAILKLDEKQRSYLWNDEDYLKNQQSYIDLVTDRLGKSGRVNKTSIIPNLLIPKGSGFTTIRETAVRMQADLVIIFTITSDTYSRYKLIGKTDIKAFATTEMVALDVRTGLIPFSAINTRDVKSQKLSTELEFSEARKRIQHEAVLLTLNDIMQKLGTFMDQK